MKWAWENLIELLRYGVPVYIAWFFVKYGFDDSGERVMVTFLLIFIWIMWFNQRKHKE